MKYMSKLSSSNKRVNGEVVKLPWLTRVSCSGHALNNTLFIVFIVYTYDVTIL
jgi:hypothetical protein